MATRSPTRRLKSVDLPTFGRPTMATRPRLTELSLGGELLSALLHFEKRVHRGRADADEADAVLTPQPLRLELVRVLDVVRVAALHLGEVDELARVRRILPAHDDDRVDQLRELARGMLALHSHRADGVEDLRLLRDLRDMRDEVLERPRWLRGLRDHAGLLHPRELLPLVAASAVRSIALSTTKQNSISRARRTSTRSSVGVPRRSNRSPAKSRNLIEKPWNVLASGCDELMIGC